jgi:hypothetical protein
MSSVCDLLRIHSRLDALFLEHQRALLQLDLATARAALEAYEIELLLHMSDEEEHLLPLYCSRVVAPVGASAEIFTGEHEKLRQYLRLFGEALAKLATAVDLEREVIWLLDSQTTFKRLLVHHDTRERKFLYPLLDEFTNEREREDLFGKLRLATPQSEVFETTR